MATEEREHQRISSLNLLHIEVYDKDVLIKQGIGRTLDVSESGIRLETHFPVDPKNTVRLSIGLKDELVEIRGRSVRMATGSGGIYEVGIKFNRNKKSSLEIVKKYVAVFKKGKKGKIK